LAVTEIRIIRVISGPKSVVFNQRNQRINDIFIRGMAAGLLALFDAGLHHDAAPSAALHADIGAAAPLENHFVRIDSGVHQFVRPKTILSRPDSAYMQTLLGHSLVSRLPAVSK
jgi:hypothetical protein